MRFLREGDAARMERWRIDFAFFACFLTASTVTESNVAMWVLATCNGSGGWLQPDVKASWERNNLQE
jgi:hypothetical protein